MFLFLVFYFGFESWLFGVLNVCKTRSQFYISRTVDDGDGDGARVSLSMEFPISSILAAFEHSGSVCLSTLCLWGAGASYIFTF